MKKFEELALMALGTEGGVPLIERVFQGDLQDVEKGRMKLPKDGSKNPVWKKIGVIFKEDVEGDALFRWAIVPEGWTVVRASHNSYSHLVDDKGRKRAQIYYKGAFYDRKADISPERRFSVRRVYHEPPPAPPRPEPRRVHRKDLVYWHTGFPDRYGRAEVIIHDRKGNRVSEEDAWKIEYPPDPTPVAGKNELSVQMEVLDGGKQVYATAEVDLPNKLVDYDVHKTKLEEQEAILSVDCMKWLTERGYTNIDDFAAYWD